MPVASSPTGGNGWEGEESQRKQNAPKAGPRQKPETPEEAAQRWRKWRNAMIIAAGGLVVFYYAWIYLAIPLYWRLFPVRLPPEVAIEDVVAEFRADSE